MKEALSRRVAQAATQSRLIGSRAQSIPRPVPSRFDVALSFLTLLCPLPLRYHLQAFRHLYVLAAEPRVLVPREVDTGLACYAPLEVTLKVGSQPGSTQVLPAHAITSSSGQRLLHTMANSGGSLHSSSSRSLNVKACPRNSILRLDTYW